MENTPKEAYFKLDLLIKSFESFKRLKEIIFMFVTLLLTSGIMYGFMTLSMHFVLRGSFGLAGFIDFIGFIIAIIVYLIGFTATGKMQFEYAKNKTSVSIGDSLIFALFSFYRFIVSYIILGIIPAVVLLIGAIYFLIARIPDLGKFLSFIGIPLFTIIFALCYFAIVLISFMLAPVVFEGNNMKEIIVKSYKIYKKHWNLLFGYIIFAGMILLIIGCLFVAVAIVSFAFASLISLLAITHHNYGLGGSMMGSFVPGGGIMSALGVMHNINFGASVIYMLIISLLLVYLMLAQSYIYLDVTSDMTFDDVASDFNKLIDKTKEKASQYKEKASSMSNKNYSQQGNDVHTQNNAQPTTQNENQGSPEGDVKICSNCGAKNPMDANFCEKCGNKL